MNTLLSDFGADTRRRPVRASPRIRGGRPLHGRVEVKGAKNLATKAMVAALLGRPRACCAMSPTSAT
jgi:UDP-N-acetylglucosamine 1-carboxyvinyltransferase